MPLRDRTWIVRRRLATQRLTGAPLPRAGAVVRLLTCVQSQDAPLAAYSLGLRSRASSQAAVLAEQAVGAFVRTHILRPTWHFVAAEDLRWIQRATAAKVLSGMAARHRALDLVGAALERRVEAVAEHLAGGARPVRREVMAELSRRGLPSIGEQVGHTLLVAELRAIVCSGPPRNGEHTYALVEDVVPAGPDDALDRAEAITRLTRRFIAGHGPVGARDLRRWCGFTLAEIRTAVGELEPDLESIEHEGETLWFDAATAARTSPRDAAYLLPLFDPAALTYQSSGFPAWDPRHNRHRQLSESGSGLVIIGIDEVGAWKRTVTAAAVTVRVRPAGELTPADIGAVHEAAHRLGGFVGRPATVVIEST